MRNRYLMALVLAACASCLAVASREPWAPLDLRIDAAHTGLGDDAYVYVDGDYRGNFVDGRFRIYLTLEPHVVRVHAAGCEEWRQTVTLTRAEYPGGREVVVRPVLEDQAP